MRIAVNGDQMMLAEGTTVAEVVRATRGDGGGRGVAVALNGEVVARSRWGDVQLHEDDRVEVLAAIGGG